MNRYFIFCVAAFFLMAQFLFAQELEPRFPQIERPRFYFEPIEYSYKPPDTTRIELFLQIPYQLLTFVKQDEMFKAGYEAAVQILDSTGQSIMERDWSENIETPSYEESNSKKKANIGQRTLYLAPGSYDFQVQIRDNESKKAAQVKHRVVVRRFSPDALGVSDPMILANVQKEGEKTFVVPNVSSNVGDLTDGFSIFFEAYPRASMDSAMFLLNVRDLKGDIYQSDTLLQKLPRQRNSCFMNVKGMKALAGDYELDLRGIPFLATGRSDTTGSTPVIRAMFNVSGHGLPAPITDLNAAIDEMQYIATRETIDSMKNADSTGRREMFLSFWRRHDPTPSTETNELMDEYFARVDYANRNFSRYSPGWRSDRGMVYVIFGAPSNVERHPFDMDAKPYEVWTYFELNREFVFVDQTGFGDYRLQTPIWDVQRRGGY